MGKDRVGGCFLTSFIFTFSVFVYWIVYLGVCQFRAYSTFYKSFRFSDMTLPMDEIHCGFGHALKERYLIGDGSLKISDLLKAFQRVEELARYSVGMNSHARFVVFWYAYVFISALHACRFEVKASGSDLAPALSMLDAFSDRVLSPRAENRLLIVLKKEV